MACVMVVCVMVYHHTHHTMHSFTHNTGLFLYTYNMTNVRVVIPVYNAKGQINSSSKFQSKKCSFLE